MSSTTLAEIGKAHVKGMVLQALPAYITKLGAAYHGDALQLLPQLPDNSISLVITSPPFALQREKEYGNQNAVANLSASSSTQHASRQSYRNSLFDFSLTPTILCLIFSLAQILPAMWLKLKDGAG